MWQEIFGENSNVQKENIIMATCLSRIVGIMNASTKKKDDHMRMDCVCTPPCESVVERFTIWKMIIREPKFIIDDPTTYIFNSLIWAG